MAIDVYEFLKVDRVTPVSVDGQLISFCGIGPCDPYQNINSLAAFRFARGAFTWTVDIAANPLAVPAIVADDNADGGDINSVVNNEITLFVEGELAGGGGQLLTEAGVWWTASQSDTNAFRDGNVVDRGFCYAITGVQFGLSAPFQRGGSGTAATDPKLYSSWLSNGHYNARLIEAVIWACAVELNFGNSGCRFRLGTIGKYPEAGGAAGDQITRNGLTAGALIFTPFMSLVCAGGPDEVKKMSAVLRLNPAMSVQNDTGNPTITGSSAANAGTINQANDGDVFTPVDMTMFGYIICCPPNGVCGVPNVLPAPAGFR